MKKIDYMFAGAVLLALMMPSAQAATVSMTHYLSGNECPGAFKDCAVSIDGIDLSPVIIKFDADLGVEEINQDDQGGGMFPSVDGSEWDFSFLTEDNKSGMWEYTAGADDPAVRYWAAKAGNGYNLFWQVSAESSGDIDICGATSYNLACLSAAEEVLLGTWFTPLNGGGRQAGLSHLTFFDTNATVVPVPAAFWLFGTALIGFIGISRRTKV